MIMKIENHMKIIQIKYVFLFKLKIFSCIQTFQIHNNKFKLNLYCNSIIISFVLKFFNYIFRNDCDERVFILKYLA